MNFFEQQDKARQRTFVLLFFYVLAVLATIISVYGAVRLCWYFMPISRKSPLYMPVYDTVPVDFWDLNCFLTVTGIVLLVVLTGTLIKIAQFSKGGVAVAKMLGGEQILPGTKDPDERKVLNVVEEMSIASGVPVPAVFLLKNEYGINAFAAGFSTQDVVIGVTRGAVSLLSRDELQGVIAHEFSHIFNGDMRLNMNLTGFLNGLLLIALTGKTLLRGVRGGHGQSSNRGSGATVFVILLFALLLLVVGYIGVFFCNWIKSAVSRQREYLADASSVQYTRNPSGLAGALKKIAGLPDGSFIRQTRAEEVSHFFFSDGVAVFGGTIFSTHPPIHARIRLLDPSFDGKYPVVRSIAPAETRAFRSPRPANPHLGEELAKWEKKMSLSQTPRTDLGHESLAESVVFQVGVITDNHLNRASEIREALPALFREAVTSVTGSIALVYGLLIDRRNTDVRSHQLEYLARHDDPSVYKMLLRLLPDFSSLKTEWCLPLLDLATPTLKTQTSERYEKFREHVETLIHEDQSVSVFEFVLKQVVLHRLDLFFGKAKKTTVVYSDWKPILPDCEILLSYIAGAGSFFRPLVEKSFFKAVESLGQDFSWKLIPFELLTHDQIAGALKKMAAASPKLKEQFLKACVHCIEHDEQLDIRELELLRAFASTLDCPIPPFIPQAEN